MNKPIDNDSTVALLKLIAARDEGAMRRLYEDYSAPVHQFILRWIGNANDAPDVMHETMMTVWQDAEKFAGRSSVRSWIFSIARNKAIDRNRRGQRVSYTDQEIEVVDETPDAQMIMSASQDAEQIRDCISKLSPPHKAVIHLAFFSDLGYHEIAEIEDCPVGTVKTRIMHAKKLILRCILNKTQS